MFFGKRKPRPSAARRSSRFRPVSDALERRDLMAVLSLLNAGVSPNIDGTPTDPPLQPAVPPDALGVQFTANLVTEPISGVPLTSLGFSVAVVGDVNGNGFDDFVISGPAVTLRNGILATVPNSSGQVFLVFGSQTVNQPPNTVSDFLGLVNNVEVPVGNPQGRPPRQAINERVGNLSNLGRTLQRSPINDFQGFNFDGITFVTSNVLNDELGFSVARAGDLDGDGFADILIGAPGADAGAGRVYVVYGSPFFNLLDPISKTINLNAPIAAQPLGIQVTTITGAPIGSRFGQSVAGVGDVITDGQSDIAIGAPFASFGNLINSGAVYLITGGLFRNPAQPRPAIFNVAPMGTVGNSAGILLTGEAPGDLAGWSVARGGNFDGGTTAAGQPQLDLLIGAPGNPFGPNNTPGRAHLVYGASNLLNRFTLAGAPPVIPLGRLGDPTFAPAVDGVTFVGEVANDLTGFAVASAGDFNGDGIGDIMIGSPGFGGRSGRVNVIYGQPIAQRLVGTFFLNDILPEEIPFLELLGEGPGALAGYSLAPVANINNDQINEILIGSPGFVNNSGAVYLIAGNPGTLVGIAPLTDVAIDLITGIQFTLARGAGFLGASVAGVLPPARARTVDGDNLGDFLIGAPLDQPIFPVNSFSSAFLVQGNFLPLQAPLPPLPPVPPLPPPPPPPPPESFIPGPAIRVFFPTINAAAPRFGESFTPTPEALSRLGGYKPIPIQVAFQQFGPRTGFGTRFHGFFDPNDHINIRAGSNRATRRDGIFVLPENVFTRGRFRVGEIPGRINHNVLTIPVQRPRFR
ncbi:hypothetical protein BH23PLA1_BH23PLA1_00630 [soil metagenome]